MVYVIKDIVEIYWFCKKMMWNSTGTLAFQAASSFFETNLEIPAFFFQNCRKFLVFETTTTWAKTLGENPTPGQWQRANPWGSSGGVVRIEIDWYIIPDGFKYKSDSLENGSSITF